MCGTMNVSVPFGLVAGVNLLTCAPNTGEHLSCVPHRLYYYTYSVELSIDLKPELTQGDPVSSKISTKEEDVYYSVL